MKKLLIASICAAMAAVSFASCGDTASESSTPSSSAPASTASESTPASEEAGAEVSEEAASDFDASHKINVVSREDGSGTRGAFVELMGIEQDVDGQTVDMTTLDAQITNSTAVMMTTVSGDPYAIGYISLGSLDDSVKAVMVDGVEATTDNVSNGTYAVARPFNVITGAEVSDVAQDFLNYIMSDEGQAIIADGGYIAVSEGAYEPNGATGDITVAGSSSVSPIMEELAEAYEAVNTGANVEVQTSDSTTGVTSAMEGTCDLGMASRALHDDETGVTATTIANDGIAVIVNNGNPVEGLTSDQIMQIFTGEITDWSGLVG